MHRGSASKRRCSRRLANEWTPPASTFLHPSLPLRQSPPSHRRPHAHCSHVPHASLQHATRSSNLWLTSRALISSGLSTRSSHTSKGPSRMLFCCLRSSLFFFYHSTMFHFFYLLLKYRKTDFYFFTPFVAEAPHHILLYVVGCCTKGVVVLTYK